MREDKANTKTSEDLKYFYIHWYGIMQCVQLPYLIEL